MMLDIRQAPAVFSADNHRPGWSLPLVILAALVVLVGVWRFPFPSLRLSFQIIFEYAVLLAFSGFVARRVNLWAGLFMLLAAWSSVVPMYSKFSFLALWGVLIGILWYSMIVMAFEARAGATNILLDAMCVVAGAHVVFLVMQTFGFDPLFTPVEKTLTATPVGLMCNKNEVAALLVFCMPAFWRSGRRIWIIPVLIGLFMAKTSMGIVSLAAGIAALIALRWDFVMRIDRRKLVLIMMWAMFGLTVFFSFVDRPSFGPRWVSTKLGIELWTQHWLFGSGLGHWEVVAFKHIWVPGDWGIMHWQKYAHNEFLQGLFEMGVLFPAVLAGYAVNAARRYRRLDKASRRVMEPVVLAMVVIAANSTGHFGFHIATTAMLGITWMAILELRLRAKKQISGGR